MWMRWNQTTHIFEKSVDDGVIWADLPLSAGIINEGVLDVARGGTGVSNGSNNTITFTGNYTLGLTLSAATSLTLPTSGTLAILGANTFTAGQEIRHTGTQLSLIYPQTGPPANPAFTIAISSTGVTTLTSNNTLSFVANPVYFAGQFTITKNTNPQVIIQYDGSNKATLGVDSSGNTALTATGTNPNITLTPGGTGYTILNGNVGIGTTGPGNLLDVGNGTGLRYIAINGANTGTVTGAALRIQNSSTDIGIIGNYSAVFGGTYSNNLTLYSPNYLLLNPVGGNVGIGTTAPNYKLEVSTDSAGKPGVGGLWTVVSDSRLKDVAGLADLDRCYEIVKGVPLKRFGWKASAYSVERIRDRNALGWLADDVRVVFPKSSQAHPFKGSDGSTIEDCLDLDGGQMLMAMYGAVQRLQADVERLSAGR